MHNKKVSKILVALLLTSMLIAILPTLPVAATSISSLDPSTGNVGNTVRIVGAIDTEGGAYTVWFDLDDDGTAIGDLAAATGNAPAGSFLVNTTFTVPECVGTDAGNGHKVTLQDLSSAGAADSTFSVKTMREITVAELGQEGDVIAINMTVVGGIASTLNNFTLTVTDPDSTDSMAYNASFTTNAVGSGYSITDFPTDYSSGASSNLTGTYNIVADRKLPGVINNAATASFEIGLTDEASYGRFETVSVKTTGWAVNQNVTITISDPSATVVKEWADQNLTTGMFVDTWVIPWNATLGTYTAEAVNATGNDKAVASVSTFEVTSAEMTVAEALAPATAYVRTDVAKANFTVTYPDMTYLNTSQFSSFEVAVYANDTLVETIALASEDYYAGDDSWQVTWKVPRDAALGSGYKFMVDAESISDTDGNTGPKTAFNSTAFTINAADLTVTVTSQPAANYTRVEAAMTMVNITYPDDTFFTDADLGVINVTAYQGTTIVANLTEADMDFNATSNEWTISWASGYNATLAADYDFTIAAGAVLDVANNTNSGAESTNAFEILVAELTVASVNTDASSYERGDFVNVYFDATYPDGSPVTTGSTSVTLTAPDGFTTTSLSPMHTSAGRWQVTWWLSESQQTGSWNVTLAADGLVDGATPTANTGPASAVSGTFTVLAADVTLDDIMDAIDDLGDRVDDVEAATSGLEASYPTLESAIVSLADLLVDLQTEVSSLSARVDTTATAAEVDALESSLQSARSELSQLSSALASLSGTAATDADLAAVNNAIDALDAAIADTDAAIDQLEAAINAMDAAMDAALAETASEDDLTAAKDELSNSIGGVNTMVIIAVVLALIAAIAAILAVYIIQRKIAG
jgi:hypothetical protein